jgi:hypothetical protein
MSGNRLTSCHICKYRVFWLTLDIGMSKMPLPTTSEAYRRDVVIILIIQLNNVLLINCYDSQ